MSGKVWSGLNCFVGSCKDLWYFSTNKSLLAKTKVGASSAFQSASLPFASHKPPTYDGDVFTSVITIGDHRWTNRPEHMHAQNSLEQVLMDQLQRTFPWTVTIICLHPSSPQTGCCLKTPILCFRKPEITTYTRIPSAPDYNKYSFHL